MQSEETRELAALIASDIVTNARSESGFDAVVGHDAAKAALEEAVLLPLRHPDLFRQSGLGGSQAGKRSSSVTAHLYTVLCRFLKIRNRESQFLLLFSKRRNCESKKCFLFLFLLRFFWPMIL